MKVSRRSAILGAAAASVIRLPKAIGWTHGAGGFRTGALGGGGFSTDLNLSPDGLTRLSNTDVEGCYLWNSATSSWTQLVTYSRVPIGSRNWASNFRGTGCYGVVSSAANSARIYLGARYGTSTNTVVVWRSDDRGASFIDTGITFTFTLDGNRAHGPHLAADPNNPDVAYFGVSNGTIIVTDNAGASTTTLTIPGATGTYPNIVFDGSGGTTGGKTKNIYVSFTTGGNGVWASTDAGATWALAAASGPNTTQRMAVASDGTLFVTDNDGTSTTNVWRLKAGTWANMTAIGASISNNLHSVAVDLNNPNIVVVALTSGSLFKTTDQGATWNGKVTPTLADRTLVSRTSATIPWLAWTNESFMSNGDIAIDPIDSDKLWIAEGIGVWTTSMASLTAGGTAVLDGDATKGIETLIVDDVLKPPGGPFVLTTQDRASFYLPSPTVFPSTNFNPQGAITPLQNGYSLNYAKDDPTFIIQLVGANIWTSTNGGQTWTKLTAQIPGMTDTNQGGCISAQSTTNWVWFPAVNAAPGYTTDGGASWTVCGGLPSMGWSNGALNLRKNVCADLVDTATYYAYNFTNGANGGLWMSVDSGANWTQPAGVGPGPSITEIAKCALIAVPGKPGHLFWAHGPGTSAITLQRCVVSGGVTTWHSVTNADRPFQVAAGRARGGGYPAIYMTGAITGDSQFGVFRAEDFTDDPTVLPTWNRLSYGPADSMDCPTSLAADPNIFGNIYIGFGASGYAVGLNL